LCAVLRSEATASCVVAALPLSEEASGVVVWGGVVWGVARPAVGGVAKGFSTGGGDSCAPPGVLLSLALRAFPALGL
jgi:hypothetical protein